MELLTEGQKLTLFFRKKNNMVEIACTISKVCDDRLYLELPQYFMRYIEFLQVGKKLTAKAFSMLGTIDFNTIVIHSPLEDNFIIELDLNSVKLTSGENIPPVKAIEYIDINLGEGIYSTKTFELSSEYLKFYSDHKFQINDMLECSLILPEDYGIIKFKANVSEIDSVYSNEYTVSFVTMAESDRQTLLYYMYMYSKNTDWES